MFGKKQPKPLTPAENVIFASTTELERALDGSEQAFATYYFALYHVQPDEDCAFNRYRDSVRAASPKEAVPVGNRYVLWGESAFQVAKWYYSALTETATPESFREYASRRLDAISHKHLASRSLPSPIALSEGQLNADKELEFYALLALSNRQLLQR
jgi:hypothetical protein